jgi:hypothetical protein
MTQEHPITPPPKLVQQWMFEFYGAHIVPGKACTDLANRASQWGADQELEACCEWLDENLPGYDACEGSLRAARRSKPPSLKEQALETLETLIHGDSTGLDVGVIRRALEALPDD